MIFIHQYINKNVRRHYEEFNLIPPCIIKQYTGVNQVEDPVARARFKWMLVNKKYCLYSNGHVFQIRKE